jgi:NAD(P)-dependent dehydrogenase (short-subunit alcohol dehydrogenase family)
METLTGKVAVVTGAASGIGLSLTRTFLAEGMNVVAADVNDAGLRDLESSLNAPRQIATFVVDTSLEAQVNALANFTMERFGAAHVLCNNAGVGLMDDPWTGTMDVWERTIGINLYGVIYGVRAFLPIMKAQGEGHIINTASMAGLLPMPGGGPYTVSKHGVVALSEGLYLEQKMSGSPIEVSVLCPAWVKTNIADAAINLDNESSLTPMQKFVRSAVDGGIDPDEVARQVVNAIVANQFWILTHEEVRGAPAARMSRAAKAANPIFTM